MLILVRRGNLTNKGAEAMLRTVRAEVGRRLPGAEFGVLTESFAGAERARVERLGFRVLDDAVGPGERILAVRKAGHKLLRPVPEGRRARLELCAALADCDALVDISGYAYGDPWGPSRAVETTQYVRGAEVLGIPAVFMPQTWGPFGRTGDRAVYREMLGGHVTFYARDRVSRGNLADLLERDAEQIPLGPDIAFRFQAAEPAEGAAALERNGLDASEPYAVLCPSRKVYTDRRKADGGVYFGILLTAARLLRERGLAVALLPHELSGGGGASLDDSVLCDAVAGCAADPRVIAVTDEEDAAVLKAMIGGAKVAVSSRFHCLVAALSCGVPPVALGWNYKYEELLEPFGLADHAVDATGKTGDDFRARLNDLLDRCETIGDDRIAPVADRHRAAIDRLFDDVARRIGGDV